MNRLLPNVADVLADRALGAHEFFIIRTRGTWEGGRFIEHSERIAAYGNIQSANGAETDARPEGGRPQDMLVLRCAQRILPTGGEPDALGDEIEVRGVRYKVVRLNDWTDYGYAEAYLKRK